MALTKSQRIGQVGIGTSQYPWRRPSLTMSTFDGTLGVLGLYSHLVALPTTAPASGIFLLGPFDPTSIVALKFHGTHGTDADGKIGTSRFWLLDEFTDPGIVDLPVEYLGTPQIDATLTIGNTTVNTSSKIITGASGNLHKWVDTIDVTADYTRDGAIKVGAAVDGAAIISWDRIGSPWLVAQLELTDATALGLVYREM